MSDFLDNLGSVLSQQFGVGENKNRSLDIVEDGHQRRFGKLGDFANKFDQSAERQYTEEGMFKADLFNPKPKQLEILMQEPDVTVLVKKRAFSSLSDSYRPDLMNQDERLLYRATKVLFKNKCKQISDFEKLTKISKIAEETGSVDYYLLPALFKVTDSLSSGTNMLGNNAPPGAFSLSGTFGKFKSIVEQVRKVVNFSQDQIYTTWLNDVTQPGKNYNGTGTGVIELTTNVNIRTTTSVNFGAGSFSLDITDPYELMLVTNNDIERAIAEAANFINNNSFIQFGVTSLIQTIEFNKTQLNNIRKNRGANPIKFIISPDTYLGKRVRAIVDNRGEEIKFDGSIFKVDVDDVSRKGGELDIDGLDGGDELDLFKQIVRSTFNQLQLNQNSRRQIKDYNKRSDATYARKKLRLYYANKLIIQPMDVVHIYAGSKTKIDEKIIGGLQDSFNGLGFLQAANNIARGLRDALSLDKNSFSLEKSVFVGNDFPNWMWAIIRNQFVADKNGAHIFAGVTETSSSSYSNGVFNVSIAGKDNTKYFDFGVVNFKPSVNVYNGALYDPITPFDIKFDTVTGFQPDKPPDLLDENKRFLKSSFVKNKNGLYAGKKPTEANFVHDADRTKNNTVRRVFYDPEGFVYKWKEGIGSVVVFGDSYTDKSSLNVSVPPTMDGGADGPFGGQDIMNVLSLLITGEPYNFATFYKAASESDNFGRDPVTGQDPSVSYFKNLQTDLKSRNLIYGNFVPFKKLAMDEESYKMILNNQVNASNLNVELARLTQQRAELSDKILKLTGRTNDPIQTWGVARSADQQAIVGDLNETLNNLDSLIVDKKLDISRELNKADKPLRIVGDDISFDYNPFLDVADKNKLSDPKVRRELRRKINYLTRRLIWKVRANEDVNLFVVDDTYDKDYDIQAFEKAFKNPALLASEYITVSSHIKRIANDLLGLEVFADSQGNIQIRPPQYNRMPSSIFYKMLKLKDELGIQLFPQFMEDLFVNQIDNALAKIEIIEDEIRIYAYALSQPNDSSAENFISGTRADFGNNTPQTTIPFKFLSNPLTGKIEGINIGKLIIRSQADTEAAAVSTKLEDVKTQASVNNIFSIASRSSLVGSNFDTAGSTEFNLPSSFIGTEKGSTVEKIQSRLFQNTGQKFDITQLFPNSEELLGGKDVSSLDILKISNDIADRIRDRQRYLKLAADAIKNAQEGNSLAENDDKLGNKLLFPELSSSKELPQAFEHLIEDESYDDFGPSSGKRYVIKNIHIKSLTINEGQPDYTSVQVNGRFDGNFADVQGGLPSDLSIFNSGNALTSAEAVDYDLWRMYGVRLPQSIEAPFLSDPQTQLAPYAVSLLTKARQHILSGSLVMVGNEFMQPGEVVYLENRDMLFYVEAVTHSIQYGKGFSTDLSLTYGHSIGEYIPTQLDVIGKVLYKNKDISNYNNFREGSVFNQEHVGTIVGDFSKTSQDAESAGPKIEIATGPYGNGNLIEINKIIQSALSAFSSTVSDEFKPILELRVFYDSSSSDFTTASFHSINLATTLKLFLTGDSNLFDFAGKKSPDKLLKDFKSTEQIVVKLVDANPDKVVSLPGGEQVSEFRYPSAKAIALARDITSQGTSSTGILDDIGSLFTPTNSKGQEDRQQKMIDTAIYNVVVDCWIYFQNPKNIK